jgi:hypothetical protein
VSLGVTTRRGYFFHTRSRNMSFYVGKCPECKTLVAASLTHLNGKKLDCGECVEEMILCGLEVSLSDVESVGLKACPASCSRGKQT